MHPAAIPSAPALAGGLSIAPMMRHSHAHARRLWRMLCPPALLYTEMLPAAALQSEPAARRYAPDGAEGAVALQLAGCEPAAMARAAAWGERIGYAEINLNCGCPSANATAGGFGACLLARPQEAAACVAAAKDAVAVPVTVKCRIAIDGQDATEGLDRFADCMQSAGADALIVHARRALLAGLSPKANRKRPPLDHERVAQLKLRMPQMQIIANGGIASVERAQEISAHVDGVMIGRAAVERTLLLPELASAAGRPPADLACVLDAYLGYCARALAAGAHPRRLLAPLAGIAAERRGARAFRRALADAAAAPADFGQVRAAAAALA